MSRRVVPSPLSLIRWANTLYSLLDSAPSPLLAQKPQQMWNHPVFSSRIMSNGTLSFQVTDRNECAEAHILLRWATFERELVAQYPISFKRSSSSLQPTVLCSHVSFLSFHSGLYRQPALLHHLHFQLCQCLWGLRLIWDRLERT